MSSGAGIPDRDANDGDLITASVLSALRAGFVKQVPSLRVGEIDLSAEVPVLIARPAAASAGVRGQARAWLSGRDGHHDASDPAEEAMLHAVETSALTKPPVPKRSARADAELVELYLGLCHHWIGITCTTGDPRYLNAALKLLAACLTAPVATTSLTVLVLSQALAALETLPRPRPPLLTARPPSAALRHSGATRAVRIAVLAGAGSKGLPLFLNAASTAGFGLAGVALYKDGSAPPQGSAYATAWYPQSRRSTVQPAPEATLAVPSVRVEHRDWPAVAAAVSGWGTDLLVLLGMGVVPALVLGAPRIGTVNAHNGALPAYRGMDAVAWALLTGDQPVCSVHMVTEAVDAGDVLAEREVPVGSADLRQAVKEVQIALLADVCRDFAATGVLPPGRPQVGVGRRFYRMHPALRRILNDAYTPGAPR
ncbi:formyltransferase family protein [Streptomyces sp. NPDC055992]|uniref:formyltransferase family protein n=1 Tax=Streptomyces sp. NPDC055992 TaxID=3345673 RepID=UPI0035DD1984